MKVIHWIKTHRYCLAGLYLFVFLLGFFLLEVFISEPKYILHCWIDDLIPFHEWFVLPYFLWYAWVPVFLIFFMIREKDSYLRLCFIMFAGATLALIIYFIWPNGLDLRREITSTNFCAEIVRFLRRIDPPCNVCPSIHVSSTVSIHKVIGHSPYFKENRKIKLLSWAVTLAICISTMFIKQHSIIDVVCGWIMTEVLSAAAYYRKQKA